MAAVEGVFNGLSHLIRSYLEFRGDEVKVFGHHHKEKPTYFFTQPRTVVNEIIYAGAKYIQFLNNF